MGKSPGKWIKSVLLGKKSSSSKSSKGKFSSRSPKARDATISAKESVSVSAPDQVAVLPSALQGVVGSEGVDFGQRLGAKLPDEAGILPSSKDEENGRVVSSTGPPEDCEEIRREKAAIKAQTAVRGFLARREFCTLKGVIRIQALMRGRLVRRQALATLRCVQAVVKFQALVRGQRVRRSSIGIEVHNKCNILKIKTAGFLASAGVSTSAVKEQLPENVFAQKLLSSTCGPSLLLLHYASGDPNSAWGWLGRWSGSHFWASNSKVKTKIDLDSQDKRHHLQSVEAPRGRTKRSARKISSPANSTKNPSASGSNKSNGNMKKLSGHPVDRKQDQPLTGSEKKQNGTMEVANHPVTGLEKKQDVTKEVVKKSVDKGKSKSKMSKCSVSKDLSKGSDGSSDKLKEKLVTCPRKSDVLSEHVPSVGSVAGALNERLDLNVQVKDNGQVDNTEGANKLLKLKDRVGDEFPQSSPRASAFPPSTEDQENGVRSAAKMPSYMAPTESARAKLRAQGSTGFSQDAFEKNFLNRRLSLPASTIGRLSLNSPRAHRPIQAARGGIRMDRSLSSSRDGSVSDRLIRPEWKR